MSWQSVHAVIMAGGGGTRLWPVSRTQQPKQSLQIVGERTLFQQAVERLQPDLPHERMLVVTVEAQASLLSEQVPQLRSSNFIIEPSPRGTAAVIGLAAVKLAAREPGSIMACLTADHHFGDEPRFRQLLRAAAELAQAGELVTLGIPPTHPATGYGYIHVGEGIGSPRGFAAHRMLSFREKPSREVAESYLAEGDYLWNSGMFVWRADRILEEIERLMPELSSGLERIQRSLDTPDESAIIKEVWEQLQPETIDYGVMERAQGVAVLRAEDLGWLDIGNWTRLFELLDSDQSGNVLQAAEALILDTKETLLYQQADSEQPRLIAALGLDNLVVVDTPDVLLICTREQAERVKELVDLLTDRGLGRYL